MNIFLLDDNTDISAKTIEAISGTSYRISSRLYCLDKDAIKERLKHATRSLVIICFDINNDEMYHQVIDILREIRIYVLIVVDHHCAKATQLAFTSNAQWVLALDQDFALFEKALSRIEQKQTYILQNRAYKVQKQFRNYLMNMPGYDYLRLRDDLIYYSFEDNYQLIIARIQASDPDKSKSLFQLSRHRSPEIDLLMNRLESLDKCFICENASDLLICFTGSDAEIRKGHQKLGSFINELKNSARNNGNLAAWFFVGSLVHCIQDIPSTYYAVKRLMAERIISKQLDILYVPNSSSETNEIAQLERFRLFDMKRTLIHALELRDASVFLEKLAQLKKNILISDSLMGHDYFQIYKTLMASLLEHLEIKELEKQDFAFDYMTVLNECDHFWNIDDLFSSMEFFVKAGIEALQACENISQDSLIVSAKRYIRTYFDMPLTLKEISEYVGVNENYFSSYFSKCTNMTFKEYQTDLRIRYAKQMLIENRLSLEEIAQAVGYSSAKYFSRVFKRVTDISPGEYRKSV